MSRVKELVKSVVSQRIPEEFQDRRVTLRLTGLEYGALLLIADRMNGTPTGTAQDILTEAIKDSLEALDYPDFHAALPDIIDVLNALENRKVPGFESEAA